MNRARGFTLLELMIVIAVMGILTSIVGVKYMNTLRKAHEGALMGDLGSMRSAMAIYYADMEGEYPSALAALTQTSRYLRSFPAAPIPNYHTASNLITQAASASDLSGWGYNNDPNSVSFGSLWVNCTHTDSKGSVWSAY